MERSTSEMPDTKRAVVFSGGGAKGGYQIGAWKALRELNFRPNVVTGTSVGALNGALMAMDLFEEALEIWNSMGMDRVFTDYAKANEDAEAQTLSFRFLRKSVLRGGADSTPLQDLVYSMMDEPGLRASPVRYGLVTTRYPELKPAELFIEDIPEGMVADYILASAAAFPVMKSRKIGDATYIDGGFSDNMPIRMAIQAGAGEIVALNIGAMPSSGTQGDNVIVHYVHAKRPLNSQFGGLFLFDRDLAQKNLQQGYLDTYKCFGLLDGYYYAFERGERYKIKPFEDICSAKFDNSFSALPSVSFLEKSGRGQVTDFLRNHEAKPFEFNSNVLHCAEAAAEIFEINPQEVYTVEGFTRDILANVQNYIDTEKFHDRAPKLVQRLEQGLGLKLMATLVKSLDKKLLTGLCLCYFVKDSMTPSEKRRLWALAAVIPEVYCGALFCCAAFQVYDKEAIENLLIHTISEEGDA